MLRGPTNSDPRGRRGPLHMLDGPLVLPPLEQSGCNCKASRGRRAGRLGSLSSAPRSAAPPARRLGRRLSAWLAGPAGRSCSNSALASKRTCLDAPHRVRGHYTTSAVGERRRRKDRDLHRGASIQWLQAGEATRSLQGGGTLGLALGGRSPVFPDDRLLPKAWEDGGAIRWEGAQERGIGYLALP